MSIPVGSSTKMNWNRAPSKKDFICDSHALGHELPIVSKIRFNLRSSRLLLLAIVHY